MSSHTSEQIKVQTTLPVLPPSSERPDFKSARLTIRSLTQDDLLGLHALRTQPEVMNFTMVGRIDKDLAETQTKLDLFLPPRSEEKFNFAICLMETGEMIGTGGVHKISSGLGWPEVGYQLKREHWGEGYATEFVKRFAEAWWGLERKEGELEVDALSVKRYEGGPVPEQLLAIVDANNVGSLKVLEKSGFRKFKEWTEPDSRVGFEGMDVTLVGFVLERQV